MGEPIISTHDKKVWFIGYAGGTEIRVAFNPQTMVDGKGLDLEPLSRKILAGFTCR
jgi:hypothetical protein